MLLKITTTHHPATDLGYLLHKHPDRFQSKELSFGTAHVFYPEVSEERCTAALLLDINAIALSRASKRGFKNSAFNLDQYVNDRPYVASSFMSTAITKILGSALNGKCKDRPDLAKEAIPLEATIAVIKTGGGPKQIEAFFSPLGYEITLENYPLNKYFSDWGNSPYYTLTLKHTIPLQHLLAHLYVLLPILDSKKHYFVSSDEVDKLLEKGKDWLVTHPAKELITKRYLQYRKSYYKAAFEHLNPEMNGADSNKEQLLEDKISLHTIRHNRVVEEIQRLPIKTVVDLGCGEGKLLKALLPIKQLTQLLGMDVSNRALEIAKKKLKLKQPNSLSKDRLQLIQSSLTYVDERIKGFDAALLVEVIEHLDTSRLKQLEKVVFGFAAPEFILITTPNQEYNTLFETLPAGRFRHADHRFEWSRPEFQAWGSSLCQQYGYQVNYLPIGPEDAQYGSPSQMAIFQKTKS